MSHDETSGPVTRKERRQKAPRREWYAGDYFRPDWAVDHLIEMLERRARGYNGLLRSILCTAAQRLRDQHAALHQSKTEIIEPMDDEAHHAAFGPDGDGA